MIPKSSRRHPVDTFFTIVLFSLFLLFLLLMLLFSVQAYRTAVSGNQTNNNLYTASAYITAKFRQHDDPGCVSARTVEELDNTSVLCLTDTVNGREYVTYIYLLIILLLRKWVQTLPVWILFLFRRQKTDFTAFPCVIFRETRAVFSFIPEARFYNLSL